MHRSKQSGHMEIRDRKNSLQPDDRTQGQKNLQGMPGVDDPLVKQTKTSTGKKRIKTATKNKSK